MPTITIAPLSTPFSISRAAENAIRHAPLLFLQTAEHPSASWILEDKLNFCAMDDLFAQAEDFDALNAAIAKRLVCGKDAVYAVAGGGIGEAQLEAIRTCAKSASTELCLLPGVSYAQAAMSAACLTFEHTCVASALSIHTLGAAFDPSQALCVEELDTVLRAGEVKLFLSDCYPDETALFFCVMDARGAYGVRQIPLYMLDRQPKTDYFASTVVILPPLPLLSRSRHGFEDLREILRLLRAPGGCPWDAKQTHLSLRASLLEECYEVLQTIDDEDTEGMCEELGDLLLQIVFHAQLEEEKRCFTMRDISSGIVNKLIYRHPHVFGSVKADTSEEVLVNWEKLKKAERHFESQSDMIDAIPRALPALIRSGKVQKKAAEVGFDWPQAQQALAKVYEEADELQQAMQEPDAAHIEEELGDLLFACVNVARLLHLNAELALQAATDKFAARFQRLESAILRDGLRFSELNLEQMDAYWDSIKKEIS